jgi:hypothetical protein
MSPSRLDVISIIYSGDTDASKEQIIAKAKVRARSILLSPLHRCIAPPYTLHPVHVGPVRYNARTVLASFYLPRVEVARRGPHMAAVHAPWTELGLHVPRMGGAVQVHT